MIVEIDFVRVMLKYASASDMLKTTEKISSPAVSKIARRMAMIAKALLTK